MIVAHDLEFLFLDERHFALSEGAVQQSPVISSVSCGWPARPTVSATLTGAVISLVAGRFPRPLARPPSVSLQAALTQSR